jgi:hypothetical protein
MRINDLLEFAPTTPEEDEKRLATFPGQQSPPEEEPEDEAPVVEPQADPVVREPQQVPAPVAAPTPPVPSTAGSIGQNLEPEIFTPQADAISVELTPEYEGTLQRFTQLWTNASKLPEDNVVRNFVFKLFQTFSSLSYENELKESGEILSTQHNLIKQSVIAYLTMIDSPELEKAKAMLEQTETLVALANDEGVKKAFIRHDTGTRLTVEEQFVKRDSELEALAQEKSKDLGMPIRWARNLIGMFGTATSMKIDPEARREFMLACSQNRALDLPGMMEAKQGKLEDFVLQDPPAIKEVFQAIKSTLLDISLSTGQGAATGPFEALLAIMGGAQKAPTGDLIINGKKYEVKSCSISIKETTTKKNGTSLAGGNSNAWLDASSEIAPAKARETFKGIIKSKGIKESLLPDEADFRPGMQIESGPLSHMANFLLHNNVAPYAKEIIYDFHAELYPDIVKLPLSVYNYRTACNRILAAIVTTLDAGAVAKEQGIMAMLQYRMGEYESGFILYNSSTQTFRVIDEPQDIVSLLREKGTAGDYQVNFQKSTITIAKKSSGRKSAPGIYFGPSANSPAGEKYIDNKRAERGIEQKIKMGAKSQEAWENGEDTPEYLPAPKKKSSSKKLALEAIDRLIIKYF